MTSYVEVAVTVFFSGVDVHRCIFCCSSYEMSGGVSLHRYLDRLFYCFVIVIKNSFILL